MHDRAELATATERSQCRGSWKRDLARAVRDVDRLIETLGLPESVREPARRAARLFPLVVPESFIARMARGDPHDPLLRQVLPLDAEEEIVAGFSRDPVGDLGAQRAPGLIHKYRGRVLLIVAGSCAIHCRYCFRRHFPYADSPKGLEAWESALRAIQGDVSVNEVILSGGDPLILSDDFLARFVRRLERVAHLRRLRVHSRLPVVLPSRVGDALLDWLTASRLHCRLVVHVNHPRELDDECSQALARFVSAGISVLNQSVLLRGVNDDADALVSLSEKLIDLGVMPYYLHQLDAVEGAAHFHVPESRGREIVREMRRRLAGFAVPRYVKEVAGAASKIDIG